MRTVEVLFVIIIILSSFTIATQFAVLPSAREAFGTELGELAKSTLEMLDAEGVLSATVFSDSADSWGELQKALSASLPVNVVYNLTVYDLSEDFGIVTYQVINSTSDTSFGAESASASMLVASPDVTYTKDVEKITDPTTGQDLTLYILNCTDARGWWITGFTGQSLATEFKNLLSPYFATTVLVNDTTDFDKILTGSPITTDENENVNNAVIINTFGEAVPISVDNAISYSGSYSEYCHYLGQKVNEYNWNWVSIVGYPFYYVTNTDPSLDNPLRNLKNAKGIYGMDDVNQAGLNQFLEGLTGEHYQGSDPNFYVKFDDLVYLSDYARQFCDKYGVYPNPVQTASRPLKTSIMVSTYKLDPKILFDDPDSTTSCIPAAIYTNAAGGKFTGIGLARTPDVRIAALSILMNYQPEIYRKNFGDSGTSRLVTLQLGQQGGS